MSVSDEHTAESHDSDGAADDATETRVRSTIAFPYTPLGDAEQVAQAAQRRGGRASMDELAAELGQVTSSGAFRTKVATARTFGVISVRRSTAQLTDLGRRLVDPKQADQARVDAFLTVPLYRRVFEEYKGHTLPEGVGLGNAMVHFGVSPKQADRARQAFQRSAEQARFFEHGKDRLVQPNIVQADEPSGDGNGEIKPPAVGKLPPGVEALMIQLLEQGEAWPADRTHEFVGAARTIYKLS